MQIWEHASAQDSHNKYNSLLAVLRWHEEPPASDERYLVFLRFRYLWYPLGDRSLLPLLAACRSSREVALLAFKKEIMAYRAVVEHQEIEKLLATFERLIGEARAKSN